MSRNVYDGPYSQPGGLAIGPPSFEFPFLQNGDSASFILTRTYKQTRAAYIADRLSGSFKLGVMHDATYTNAWLIAETPYSVTATGLFQFQRRFAPVPSQQIVPGSQWVTFPPLEGDFPQEFGTGLILQPDSSVGQYQFYTRSTVTSDSGAPAAGYPTGGTYTLTFNGSTTTSLAYNASAATVEAALDLLASVIAVGGVAVTGSYNSTGGLIVTFPNYSAGTVDASGLTVSSGTPTITGTLTALFASGRAMQLNIQKNDGLASNFNGGSFTITIFGQTTAGIAFATDVGTLRTNISTALNALRSVTARGGATVYTEFFGAGQSILYSFFFPEGTAFYQISGTATALTPLPASITNVQSGSLAQALVFAGATSTRTLVASAAHGIVTGDDIYVKQGTDYVTIGTGNFTVPSTTTIVLNASAGVVVSTATTITEVGKKTTGSYTAGSRECRVTFVSDYYLVGVTPGITSAADIPLPAYEGDADSMLEAIIGGSTSINIQTGGQKRWRESPIIEVTTVKLDPSQL
jgi:hypothetical protein